MSEYHCPQCGKPIGFGESICPNCKADVTSVWEVPDSQSSQPKVAPGTGGVSDSTPFPPPGGNSPFPPPASSSPFPPPANNSPFPPPSGSSPFPTTTPPQSASPFPPAAGSSGSKPFPPVADGVAGAPAVQSGPYLDIPQIGGKLFVPPGVNRIGRDEIQGIAMTSLPDMNAYKNISRRRDTSEHFILTNQNGSVTIEDQHSTNGTYLGTTKLQGIGPQPLKEGDKVILPIEEFGKMVQLELIFHTK